MTIKHLVLTSGGPSGLVIYGAAKLLAKKNFWNIKDIKTIYGCSIGSFIGFILSLDYDWNILDDYLIKRPWNNVIKNNTNDFLELYSSCGLINDKFFSDTIESLLLGKNLELNITMNDLYIKTNKELHFIATEIYNGNLNEVDISYKSHPNLPLCIALKMSMSFPILFQPIYYDNKCYIDGGLLNSYPLKSCINNCINNENNENNENNQIKLNILNNNLESKILDEILTFRNIYKKQQNYDLNEKSNISNFIYVLINTIQNHLSSEDEQPHIKNTVYCEFDERITCNNWFEILNNRNMIINLIKNGEKLGEKFYEKIN